MRFVFTIKVNDAAFELADNKAFGNLNLAPIYTNICATCGENIINFIDVESGKVVKRFNDEAFINNSKEVRSSV